MGGAAEAIDAGAGGLKSSGCCEYAPGPNGLPPIGLSMNGRHRVYDGRAPEVHRDQHVSLRRPSPSHSGASSSNR